MSTTNLYSTNTAKWGLDGRYSSYDICAMPEAELDAFVEAEEMWAPTAKAQVDYLLGMSEKDVNDLITEAAHTLMLYKDFDGSAELAIHKARVRIITRRLESLEEAARA